MIRVLIVDDSPTMRALLTQILAVETDIEVVGAACDAEDARAMIRKLDPDVVTLDIEMPKMSGLDFLERLMRLRPTPVVIVSSLTRHGADITAEALAIGAVDCYAKPDGRVGDILSTDVGTLAGLIRDAAQTRARDRTPCAVSPSTLKMSRQRRDTKVIAIGSSTGGVEALQSMLTSFPEDCPPTVVVQHINGQFAEAVTRRLDQLCRPKVMLAEPDLRLRPGHVYLAPGNERHLQVRGTDVLTIRSRTGDPVSGHRPSVDALFGSVAQTVAPQAIGILLTGMGRDGAAGLLAMRRAGALTIAQDEASSTVFGMPRAAIELGAAEHVLPLTRIATFAIEAGGA